MKEVGIMQGRLVSPVEGRIQAFPRDRWADEFTLAATAGLQSIEWIYEVYGMDVNPIATDGGIAEMHALTARHGVGVHSCCADYFMDRPLLRAEGAETEDRFAKLVWLLGRCRLLAIRHIVLPFVDASRLEGPGDIEHLIVLLRRALPAAEEAGVELHLETSLPPSVFATLLAQIEHPFVKANYDSGNSASLGYDPREEFAAYGPRIGSVHIKDRLRGGTTVPLETGDADFDALFDGLKHVNYDRGYILQVARDVPGDEVAWARKNLAFVQKRTA